MLDALTELIYRAWGYFCASPADSAGHGLAGPVLGNLLVLVIAGGVTLFCFVVALRLLIRPGEYDENHPKYRVLRPDR